MSLVQSEEVLVIPTTLLHQLGYFQGFSPEIIIDSNRISSRSEILLSFVRHECGDTVVGKLNDQNFF